MARLQDTQPAWRKADLIRHLGELLPDDVACPDDTTRLHADRPGRPGLGGGGGSGCCCWRPGWPRVPDSLHRATAQRYRPHSGNRYTTAGQLTMEDRLVTQAQQPARPGLSLSCGAAPRRGSGSAGGSAPRRSAELRPTAVGYRLGAAVGSGGRRVLAVTSDRRPSSCRSGRIRQTRTAAVVAAVWRQAGWGRCTG